MLRTTQKSQASHRHTGNRSAGTAPLRRPGAVAMHSGAARRDNAYRGSYAAMQHALCRSDENAKLLRYEDEIKQAFDAIVPTLKQISAIQHEQDFAAQAQRIARDGMGFELPENILADAWVEQLDMRRLFAWCVFYTYRHFCDAFFSSSALTGTAESDFDAFLQSCGFHTLDITPCADGRLAHLIRFVLRLPPRAVRRKSYAGAMFDVEDSIQKWVEIELQRHREGLPNTADAATRYLKVVAYHFSSGDPHEGCAAHGSDTQKAAQSGLERLVNFRQAIENSFCCGASIDLLLIGLDTDTDAIQVHVPDADGQMSIERFIDAQQLHAATAKLGANEALGKIEQSIQACSPQVTTGMAQLIARLVENNFSQIDYVRERHGSHYPDIGHAERFIGAGIGFEDIQLRNLMYFAYLNTVEEGAADLDVGIRIFSGLNVTHGLPVPVVVRFDYHGQVPGARERAQQRCARVAQAMAERFRSLCEQGLLHVMQVARDCDSDKPLEIFACSVNPAMAGGH